MTFGNIVARCSSLAPDKQHLRFAGVAVFFGLMMALPPARGALPRQILDFELRDIGHNRPFDPYRVVLFACGAVIRHMLGG